MKDDLSGDMMHKVVKTIGAFIVTVVVSVVVLRFTGGGERRQRIECRGDAAETVAFYMIKDIEFHASKDLKVWIDQAPEREISLKMLIEDLHFQPPLLNRGEDRERLPLGELETHIIDFLNEQPDFLRWFQQQGIEKRSDLVDLMIRLYWKKRHQKPLKVTDEIEAVQKYREKLKEERALKRVRL